MIASPIATSAAATVIINNTKRLPSILLLYLENETRAILDALSINSRLIKIMIMKRKNEATTERDGISFYV